VIQEVAALERTTCRVVSELDLHMVVGGVGVDGPVSVLRTLTSETLGVEGKIMSPAEHE
jgi:hypothetical protein